ncbi:MAG: UDP-N-acetylmuramate dehydrogenase [Natronincolaceae bacterium]|jgi:UDP-N-acetylmuramate dehydrogenase|nr:UDP-N-acetylmuramate dehydrogenase [Bacillota bacterium]NLK90014.1 UDP-N-acetylmuramate dehydrogenase [Clostridiales bacterium]
MDKIKIYNKLTEIISKDAVLLDEPMKNHTSIRVGGTADIMATPRTIAEIQSTIKICKENNTPYFIMGNGSNLIVRDKGMRCVVIKLGDRFANVDIDGNTVVAQAGVLLSTLSEKIMAENLTGFEFANGIPGTLGGAVAMNAGAYGGEMQDVVRSVKVLSPEGKTKNLLSEELEFGYRTSAIQTRNYIVLEVEMEFEKGDYDKIVATTKELIEKRTMKQPLNLPSCGSVFKRPVGHFAGKLIEDSGLKGEKIGGAQVSELHCGFIVNIDNATANDVLDLIKLVQETVKYKFGIQLETEVKIIGEE